MSFGFRGGTTRDGSIREEAPIFVWMCGEKINREDMKFAKEKHSR
jgi:hypothetical protein